MKLFLNNDYEALSIRAADDLIEKVRSIKRPLISPASGDSTAGLYRNIVERVQQKQLDVSNWLFVGLDEWAGMNGSDEGSCRYHLDQQLFLPLRVAEQNICFFDGRRDLQMECKRVEDFIQRHGGIDVAIVGLGLNGHVGMNEPGTPPNIHSHIAEIHSATAKAAQKYFKTEKPITEGVTLGVANLMEARHLMLLVNGSHKSQIVQRCLEEPVSEQLPATLLRDHPSFGVYLEPTAAQLMLLHSQKS